MLCHLRCTPQVAEAVFEAVLPRQAGDQVPSSPAGILASVADKLDSLVGLTAAVGAPSATAGELQRCLLQLAGCQPVLAPQRSCCCSGALRCACRCSTCTAMSMLTDMSMLVL